jgi:hypothetical protein
MSHYPQSNGVIEQYIFQVVGNSQRTFQLESATLNEADPWSAWSVHLASVAAMGDTQYVPYGTESKSRTTALWQRHGLTNPVQG